MIIDSSLFAFEVPELVRLRVAENQDVVDHWIFLECAETTRGAERRLRFGEVWPHLAPWHDRISYHVLESMPGAGLHPQKRFGLFRDISGNIALERSQHADDVILLCDGDEIPRAATVAKLRDGGWSDPSALGMSVYYYDLVTRFRSLGRDGDAGGHGYEGGWPLWRGPVVTTARTLAGTTANALRETGHPPLIANGGWHFSALCTPAEHRVRLLSQGHIESDDEAMQSLANLEAAHRDGRDWDTRRNLPLERVPIDDSYPRDIIEHPERWKKWISSPREVKT